MLVSYIIVAIFVSWFLEEIPLFTKSLDMEIFFDSLPYTYAFDLF